MLDRHEALALVQNSLEWEAARCGSVGASRVADIMRKGKNGEASASRKNYLTDLVLERLTGRPREGFVSRAMQDGKEREAEARRQYSFLTDNEVEQVGIYLHPLITGAHASPDGIIGEQGLYEGKAPEPAQHLAALQGGKIAADYQTQCQWQMACSGRSWCDWVSFHPDFPVRMQLCIIRVTRDAARIEELEMEVGKFLLEVKQTVERLQKEFGE